MKKTKFILIFVCLAFIIITGCEKKSNEKNNSSSEKRELIVASWGGAFTDAYREAVYKPFEEKYNCKIIEATADYGQLRAMEESGKVEWDILNAEEFMAIIFENEGLLEELDYSKITVPENMVSTARKCSIPAHVEGYSLTYNTETYKNDTPQSWEDFWDLEKFPGKRSLYNFPMSTLESALLADGVEMKDLYPLDVDRAFNSLDKIKDNVSLFYSYGSQIEQFLNDGSIDMSLSWLGRAISSIDNGASAAFIPNQTAIAITNWIIPKNAPHSELAMQFIDFAMSAEVQANLAKIYPLFPTFPEAYTLLSDIEKERQVGNPEYADIQYHIDADYWAENYNEINERWQEWIIN